MNHTTPHVNSAALVAAAAILAAGMLCGSVILARAIAAIRPAPAAGRYQRIELPDLTHAGGPVASQVLYFDSSTGTETTRTTVYATHQTVVTRQEIAAAFARQIAAEK